MSKTITRREAIRNMLLLGTGLAAGGSILDACSSSGEKKGRFDIDTVPWTEAPEGSRIDTRTWASLGEKVGMLGLGCMRFPTVPGGDQLDQVAVNEMVDYAIAHGVNYFDTAPIYGESEVVTGKALSRHPRSSYLLATKLSNMVYGNQTTTLEDAKKMFETSLKNLQVDYFDFFLLHHLNTVSGYEKRFINNGVLDYLLEQKQKGRIKHLGFSFHGYNKAFVELLNLRQWDFVQIQVSYADWKNMPFPAQYGPQTDEISAEFLYNALAERGIPAVVMEPVKGGNLASVSDALAAVMRERHPSLTPAGNALTFVGSLPGVMVTLSGMSNMDQLKENVSTFTGFKPFDQKEMDFMLTVADLYNSNIHIPCTACEYCMPCPHGVNIPGNFRAFNTASDNLTIPNPDNQDKTFKTKKKAFLKLYKVLPEEARSSACITCNACLPKCPQHIEIPKQLKMIDDLVSKL